MTNLSLWHVTSEHSELRPVAKPATENLIPITSYYSLISAGTEKMVATGRVPAQSEPRMAVPHMQGAFKLPVKYGYSLVGKIPSGELVHTLHPHQQIAWVARQDLFILPADADPRRMTLLSNMETIINAIWDSEHLLKSASKKSRLRIAICGFGNIGALLGLTLRKRYQVEICIIDINPWRISKAASLGFEVCLPDEDNGEFDLIYHTSCNAAGLQWCIERATFEGSIIELSWYANKVINLRLGEQFHYNRLKLISSQVSNIPKHKAEETFFSRKLFALEFLQDACYDTLFADDIDFADSPAFFSRLRSNEQLDGLTWCIRYL